jgi:hypothetical protein
MASAGKEVRMTASDTRAEKNVKARSFIAILNQRLN